MTKKALVVFAEGFEEIEALTPVDVMRRLGIEVVMAGLDAQRVTGSHGITVTLDTLFDPGDTCFDAVVLPGGMPGTKNLAASQVLQAYIRDMHTQGRMIAAICAAPAYVLPASGILVGKKATCYPGCESLFGAEVQYVNQPVVVDKNIITSQGAGTALAFSFALVEQLLGTAAVEQLKKKMVYI